MTETSPTRYAREATCDACERKTPRNCIAASCGMQCETADACDVPSPSGARKMLCLGDTVYNKVFRTWGTLVHVAVVRGLYKVKERSGILRFAAADELAHFVERAPTPRPGEPLKPRRREDL